MIRRLVRKAVFLKASQGAYVSAPPQFRLQKQSNKLHGHTGWENFSRASSKSKRSWGFNLVCETPRHLAQTPYARALASNPRNPSGEIDSAPHACTVSASIKSEVAMISSKRLAYLLANRSMMASADWPPRE